MSDEIKIPETLKDAVDVVIKELCLPSDLPEIRSMTEERYTGLLHFSGSSWMRNNWGLWKKDSNLYREFKKLGLWHADDMSGLILKCAWRELNGLDWNVEKIVMKFLEHWNELGVKGDIDESAG